ncbi:MAG: tetratricopeptide repeat protein, partial [Deltaproteobacteria bacterium]|nr:tetratricopeptide repeat protein [Deltaproteobacteria bacterium]
MKTRIAIFLLVALFCSAAAGSENLKLAAGAKTLDELIQNLKKFNEELKTSPETAKETNDEFLKMIVASYARLFEAGEYRTLIFLCGTSAGILNNGDVYHICAKPHCQLGESDSCRSLLEKYLGFHKGDATGLKSALSGITSFLIEIYRLEDAYFFQQRLEEVEPDKTSAKLRSAELLLKMNRKEEADKIYREIIAGIQSKEERLKAVGEIGKKLMQYHVYDKALFFYQEVLKENSGDISVLFVMIKIHYALKNNQAIVSLAENFLAGAGYGEDVILKIADFLEFEPSRAAALAVLKTAGMKKPGSGAIKFALGKALYESGKTTDARKMLNGLARSDAEYAEKVSDFYIQKNDRKAALNVYKQFKLSQENYKTKLREISLMVESGMFKEAAREADNGEKILKEPGAFMLEAGGIFYKSKKFDAAKKYLLKGIAGAVQDRKLVSESYFMLAGIEIASKKKDPKAAENYLENYLKFADYGGEEMDKAIEICRNSKFENLAVKILTRKIEKSPENPESYLELAELNILQNKPVAAIDLLTRYTALSDNKITAINRAVAALASGGMSGLEPDLLSALEDKNINDPLFNAYLGQIYLGKGNILKAARHLWKFIAAPENKSPQQLNLVDELASRGLTSAAAALLSGIIPSLNEAEREGATLALGRLLILSGD